MTSQGHALNTRYLCSCIYYICSYCHCTNVGLRFLEGFGIFTVRIPCSEFLNVMHWLLRQTGKGEKCFMHKLSDVILFVLTMKWHLIFVIYFFKEWVDFSFLFPFNTRTTMSLFTSLSKHAVLRKIVAA